VLALGVSVGGLTLETQAQITVVYPMQVGNFATPQTVNTNASYGAGVSNNNSFEIKTFAFGSGPDYPGGDPGVAIFQIFNTSGQNSATPRPMKVGDEFIITAYVQNSLAFFDNGNAGISFNGSTANGQFSDYNLNQRARFQINQGENWFSAALSTGMGFSIPGSDVIFRIKLVSEQHAILTIEGPDGGTAYEMKLAGVLNDFENIQGFAIWNQTSGNNNDVFWKNASLTSTGTADFGGGNGSATIDGIISDGLDANSTTEVSVNKVVKTGTGTITFSQPNTYTGITEIQNGTLRIEGSGTLGLDPKVDIRDGGELDLNGIDISVHSIYNAVADFELSGILNLGSAELIIYGDAFAEFNAITGVGGSIVIDGSGTLILQGTFSYTGNTTVNDGELRLAAGALASTNYIVNGGLLRSDFINSIPSTSTITVSGGTWAVNDNTTLTNLTIAGGEVSVAAGKVLTVNGTLELFNNLNITLGAGASIIYGPNSTLKYSGTIARTTSNFEWPNNQPANVTIANSGGVTLHANRDIRGKFTIESTGNFIQNGFDLTVVNGGLNGDDRGFIYFTGGQYAPGAGHVHFPFGGYTKGNWVFKDLFIGATSGNPNMTLYVDDDISISGDLEILQTGELRPGTFGLTNTPTIRFVGPGATNLNNQGLIRPLNGGRTLVFSFEGETFLLSNSSPPNSTQFSDVIVTTGSLLSASSTGNLNIEFLNGTLTNNGSIFFGDGTGGTVRAFIAPSNTLTLNIAGTAETRFNQFSIGDGGTLRPSTTSVFELEIKENFVLGNNANLNTINGAGRLHLAFTGTNGPQEFIKASNLPSVITFQKLIVDTDTAIFFKVPSFVDAARFRIQDELILTHGIIATLDTLPSLAPIRHKLVINQGASINYTGATGDTHVAGPLFIEHSGTDLNLSFPVGQGEAYRRLDLVSTRSTSDLVEIVCEVFSISAYDLNHTLPTGILNISDLRIWTVFSPAGDIFENSNVTLHYGGMINEGVNEPSALRVLQVPRLASPTQWTNLGPESGGSVAPGTIQSNAFNWASNSGYDFTLGNTQAGVNPLPVTWLTFAGVAEERANTLMWSTASELNNDYFEVQRSRDGASFYAIGQVQGQGTTNVQSDYAFSDDEAPSGTVYYRLQQFDFDGASDFSETVAITRKGNAGIYPNPFNESLNIAWEGGGDNDRAVFAIWDATGRKVAQYAVTPPLYTIDTGNLPHGSYFGELRAKDSPPLVFKLIK
jgi:autotransporter-associated beta strand protein